VFLVTASAILLFLSKRPETPAGNGVISRSTDTPAESQPKNYVWTGSKDDPKYIKLPSIGAEGFIQKVGIDRQGQVAAPNNIQFAGWYINSARPGAKGLGVIDGHVDGLHSAGIFKELSALSAGDVFNVELGSGKKLHYKVRKVQTVGLDQALNVLFSQYPDIPYQLNLITCGGTFSSETKAYDKRVIVVAAQT
jgi:LPXTG-site transpeptidase (sortase) family protein